MKVAPAVVAPDKAAAHAPTPGAPTSTTARATPGVGAAADAAIPFGKGSVEHDDATVTGGRWDCPGRGN